MQVDTLIQARWIIPVEPHNVILEDHALVTHEGRILDILPVQQAHEKYQAKQLEILADHALIPGLINTHTHLAMTLFRGISADLHLMDWLENHIWPLEKKWVNEAFVRDGTDLAIAEMLRGGTTCFNDASKHFCTGQKPLASFKLDSGQCTICLGSWQTLLKK
jgi:5-methylthioadenosine/S-adenosylhomocysteine deaminase